VPREVFVAGQILTAAEMNVVSDQTVMSFAGTAARGSAIASPTEGMVAYLSDADRLEVYTTAWEPVNTAFTAGTTITASGTAISVPTLGAPIVRVTVIGGGGGGGAAETNNGGNGGTTTFDAGVGGTASAAGGLGGYHGNQNIAGRAGTLGSSAGNGGMGAVRATAGNYGAAGLDGAVTVAYLNLTGVSTFTVTVGAGGTGGAAGAIAGGAGGRGEARLEYVAG
jgi:hypothetical protein